MLKQKLQSLKSGDIDSYNHLLAILRQIVITNNKDAYQLFEHFSQAAKSNQIPQHVYRDIEFAHLKEYVASATKVLGKINTGTQQEPAQPGPTGYVPNLMQQSKWFERAGIGFGQQCTFLLFKSLERLSVLKQVKQLKFWGKIICSDRDYWIAESPSQGEAEGQLPPDVEPKGQGVNKMTYWVATDLLKDDWKQLPIISPTQLKVSRQIKYVFTGNLQRQVFSNPHFGGSQAHLLKCQIVRINFGCTVVPRTMFTVNAENNKQVDPTQQWKIPNFQFLSNMGNWVHHPQNILKNGRMTLLKPEIPEGVQVDQQKLMKQLQAKDPVQSRLKPINEDLLPNKNNAWAIKTLGDTCEYRAMTKNKQTINYGFICIRSLIWKGWTLIYHNKQWVSLYVGYGNKCSQNWYYPCNPEKVLQQNNDHQQQPQPNFPPQQQKPAQNQGEQQPPE